MFQIAFSVLVIFELVFRTQTFRLMAEGLDSSSFHWPRTAQEAVWPTCKAGVGNVDPGGPVSLQSLAPTLIKHTRTS